MDRAKKVLMNIIPKTWDSKPLSLAHELVGFLQTIKDEGTGIDSGSMDGLADLWVTVQGIEYIITIKPSRAALKENS